MPEQTIHDIVRKRIIFKKWLLKRKGISYLLWFFIAFFTVAIIADNIFILDEWVRWLILIAGLLFGVFILIYLWFLPSREYTSEKALGDIESERGDGVQLLRTAHQLEEKEQLSRNSLERKVLEEANELTSGKIWNTKYNNALDRSYWILSRLFVIFLFVVLLSNGARVGLFRTLLPFAEIHYTRIKTENPREFNPGEEVSVNVSVRGRRLNKVSIFINENADWKELKFKTERNKRFQLDLKNRKKKFKYYVAMGDGKSQVKTINMVSPPKIDSAWADIEFPGYMQKENEIQTGGHVKAYVGSWVYVHLKISQRMQEGRITLPGGTQTLMQVNNNELSFGFQMTDSLKGEYLVDGLDEHNEMLPVHKFKIESLVDQLPSVKLIDFTKDIEATSVTEIPISIHAYDEIGLSEVGLVAKVDNKEKEIARFAYNDSIVLERTELAQLLLEEFDVNLQSNVRIYAWAKDRNPNHEKRGVSVLRGIDIRPFRYTYLLPPPPGEAPPPAMPQAEEALMQLEEMIQVQRNVLSKAFKAAEEGGEADEGQKLSKTELSLSADAGKIYRKIKGKSGKADVLKQAGSKLDEASGMFDKADFKQGFNYGDQAMNLLTTLRDEVLKSLNKANASSSSCCKKKDVLSELAIDVDALIKQEQDVLERHQLFLQVPGNIDNFFQSTNLQRKILVDTRELKSMLDIHPDGTKLSMERMDEVINEMSKSKDLLEGQKDAVGQINLTILRMQELAEHLRGMNVNPSGDMMRKAREKVEAVAQNLEKQAKDKKTIGKKDKNNSRPNDQQSENQGKNEKKSEKGAKSESQQNSGESLKKPGGAKPGSKSEDKPGETPGQNGEGTNQAGGASQMIRDMQMVEDWLNSMSTTEDGKNAKNEATRQRLRDLIKKAEIEKMLDELKKIEKDPSPIRMEQLSKQLEEFASLLRNEELNLTMSKLDRLGAAKEMAIALKQNPQAGNDQKMELVDFLKMFNDEELTEGAKQIAGGLVAGNTGGINQVISRLNEMIDELLKDEIANDSDIRVPGRYRHMVEKYFKALSDDIEEDPNNQ